MNILLFKRINYIKNEVVEDIQPSVIVHDIFPDSLNDVIIRVNCTDASEPTIIDWRGWYTNINNKYKQRITI